MKHLSLLFLTAWISLPLAAFSQSIQPEAVKRTVFFDTAGMDTSVLPGNDFYSYANGNYVRQITIPGDWIGWGVFPQLIEENERKTKAILEEMATPRAQPGRIEQLVGDFYASGLDTTSIEQRGFEPLKPDLDRINALSDHRQLVDWLVTDESYGHPFAPTGNVFISFYVGSDERQSTISRMNFRQAGLSMPEKGYYTRTDEATQKIRTGFLDYVTRLFTLIGVEPATARTKAEAILAFETRLAQSHKSPVELRDPLTNYHPFAVAELDHRMPNLNWRAMLDRLELQRVDTVLVAQPAYYQALDSLLPVTPISLIKDRLMLDLLTYNAHLLSKAFEQASFDFYRKTLYGQPRLPDRWKRLAKQIDGELDDALGQVWVKRYFPAQAKERLLLMVNNLQQVYHDRIQQLDWMSPQTKSVALAKLAKFTKKIGYPDQWKAYSGVVIRRDDYFGNVQQTRRYWNQQTLAKVNRPVDRLAWNMTAPTVNAYANYTNNEIVFPAGMLQYPYFDPAADDAINYGGIGAVIGHEMTHLFDDQGRKYDAGGNLRDWWTPQDAEQFATKSQVLVEQYNQYKVLDSLSVNGRLTLGENLADLGGLTLAYQAFKRTQQGQSSVKIDGFTPDQRFFLGYAQIWRSKMRAATERAWLLTNPHSPDKHRVNGPLTNFAPFYRAFEVKPGQRLYKPEIDRVKVW